MANPTLTELVTSTLRERRSKIADAITRNNALLYELRRRRRINLISGGRTITEPILYGEASNFQWYSGRDALNVAGQEHLTAAEFLWKQWACGVSISGLEQMMNDGPNALIKMLKARIMAAEKTIQNQLHSQAYADGTAATGKVIGGMDLLIADAAGATVGGIDSSTATWWDNKRAALSGGPTTANIYSAILNLMLATQRGADRVNLVVSDNTYYSVLSAALQGQQRFMSARLADAGFRNLMFEGTPVVADGGDGGYAPVGMFGINLSTITLTMHRKRNNVVLAGPKRPITEDSETVMIAGMGNMTVSDRARNWRLYSTA